jgi:transcriptional regulator of acetoin/glycerol metabolism
MSLDLDFPPIDWGTAGQECMAAVPTKPRTVDDTIAALLRETLVHTNWYMERAAHSLGVSAKTVYNWRRKYQIDPPTPRAGKHEWWQA